MGEVYLAQDLTLERSVALKILPPELVRNEERLRRFILEAKSASSLNHPNIVTIYEIGRDEVRTGDESHGKEPPSAPVHFISMERVDGRTLTDKIHAEKEDLRTLLGHLAQVAEGLAKAHAAGIVHRDLKPGNVMVSKDGYAKVLDFGLAKLTEAHTAGTDPNATLTTTKDRTGEGVVVGTAGYMSPEQVQGKSVDSRSDIFSFGCILYEAVTRRRAFDADSAVETMHRILHDTPQPPNELNPTAPAELRRLIRRCLAKSADQRLQSMKDLAIELREIVENYDTLSISATSGSGSASGVAVAPPARRRARVAWIAVAGLLGVAGLGFGIYKILSPRGAVAEVDAAGSSLRMTPVSVRGPVWGATLSGDGRYLAYVSGSPGQLTLWVRQLSTGSEVRILPPSLRGVGGLCFSPNGDYLYYVAEEPGKANLASLFQVPSLGGPPRKRVSDVTSAVSFAPDGRRVCFLRRMGQKGEDLLIVRDLESGEERTLATAAEPLNFWAGPSWSPDGKTIATAVHTAAGGVHAQVLAVNAEDGTETRIGTAGWEVGSLAWLPDGSGLVLAAGKYGASESFQLWTLSYPEGRVRRLTNDASNYWELSVSGDGATLAALRQARLGNLWVVSAAGKGRPRQITFNSSSENSIWGFELAGDDAIVFTAANHLWMVGNDGEGLRQLTSGSAEENLNELLPDGGILFSHRTDDRISHIWRADADGGNPRSVTKGAGEWCQDLSPDGKTLLYARVDSPRDLWSVPIDGGEPLKIASSHEHGAEFSPDGKRVAFFTPQELEGRSRRECVVIPASGGAPVATLSLPPRAYQFQWTPDGSALTFVDDKDGVQNILRQPIPGGEPRQITHFTEGQISDHEWFADGGRILLNRRTGDVHNLWSVGPDGRDPVPITDFVTGSIFQIHPTRNGKEVVFTYGTENQDIVLVQGFR